MSVNESHQYIVFRAKGRTVQSLVDSGSPKSLMSQKLARQLNLKIYPLENQGSLVSATGQALRLLGKTSVPCNINELCISHIFIVVEHIFPNLVVGTDFLSQNQAVINYRDNTLDILDGLISMPLQKFHSLDNCAVVHRNTVIPKYCEAVVPVKVPRKFIADEILLEPLKNNTTPVLVAESLSTINNGIAQIRVLNIQLNSVVLRKNSKIASLAFPATINSITKLSILTTETVKEKPEITQETLNEFIKDYQIQINDQLNPDEKLKFQQLLYQYKDIFARDISEMRTYQGYQLELHPKNPFVKSYTRQYNLNEGDTEEAHRQIVNLHKQGLVEKTVDCSFNSPLFLVRKKFGKSRMVVDLRRINAILKPLIVALPKIDELLADLVKNMPKYISSVDMFKGYWSIKLHPKTRHYTSFTDPKTGVSYQYSVLPMGLNVSAAAFVLAMGRVFQDKQYYHFLYNYIDDIAIASRTFPEHLTHLETIFKTVRANNMRLNPTKTSIGFHEMEFLGFTVSDKGISISPSKMEAIKRIAPPSNRKSLQKLIGLVQYFRCYIPNFNTKIANMRQLLKRTKSFSGQKIASKS